MAHLLMGIDKITDQQGYLVISNEGAVLASSGDLENDERLANHITNLVQIASKIPIAKSGAQYFRRLTVTFKEFNLLITLSNQRIYAVKRPLSKTENLS